MAVSIIIFVMVRLLPGSILDLFFAGDNTATPEQMAEAKKQLGLTGSYSGAVLALDLGRRSTATSATRS